MSRHLEVIHNFEHLSLAPNVGNAETADDVRAATLPVIELLQEKGDVDMGICFLKIEFYLGEPRHPIKKGNYILDVTIYPC